MAKRKKSNKQEKVKGRPDYSSATTFTDLKNMLIDEGYSEHIANQVAKMKWKYVNKRTSNEQ